MYMWGTLYYLCLRLRNASDMVEGGNLNKEYLVGPWALAGRALLGQARKGRAIMAPPGPLWAWLLLGLPGPLWAGP